MFATKPATPSLEFDEFVRESDEQVRAVARAITSRPVPGAVDEARPNGAKEKSCAAPQSPFAPLLAEAPGDDELPARQYRAPSLAGRARPIGGMQEDVGAFRVRYTAATSHAIRLEA